VFLLGLNTPETFLTREKFQHAQIPKDLKDCVASPDAIAISPDRRPMVGPYASASSFKRGIPEHLTPHSTCRPVLRALWWSWGGVGGVGGGLCEQGTPVNGTPAYGTHSAALSRCMHPVKEYRAQVTTPHTPTTVGPQIPALLDRKTAPPTRPSWLAVGTQSHV